MADSEDTDLYLFKTNRHYFIDEIILETKSKHKYKLEKIFLINQLEDFREDQMGKIKYFLVDSY